MSAAFLCLVIFLFSGSVVLNRALAQTNPCGSYASIREKLRSTGYEVKNHYDSLVCDRNLAPGWYRFNSGTDGEMPTTCPDMYHCNTHIPLWLNGSHPTVAQGTVTREVCGHTPSGCCGYKDTIKVHNCGTFYVYYLKPTRGCSVGYCAGSRTPCPPDKWSSNGYEPGCKDIYPKMTQNPTLSNPIVKPHTFEFNCHVNFDPSRTDVGFDVTWLFDGKPDVTLTKGHITGATRDLSIDQKFLVGHLGEALSCRVDAYFKTTPGRKGPGIVSNNYWMGLQLSPSQLVVGTKDPPQEVKLISTIPMVCDAASARSCHLDVYLEPNNHNLTTTQNCTVTLRPGDWDPSTNQAVVKFDVLAQRSILYKDKNLVLHFTKTNSWDAPPIFNNYQIPSLPILSKDSPTSLCSCYGDPHCITLDRMPSNMTANKVYPNHAVRKLWYSFYKLGEFVMYKSTNPNRVFEVQIRNWQCWKVTCICAVVVREGNDVVKIDMCHHGWGKTFVTVTADKGNVSTGAMVQKDKTGNTYVISFPSGALVTVINHGGKWMGVHVHAPEDDYEATEGLCGTFDGNKTNDLTGKDGHVYPFSAKPDNFTDSWRVPVGSSMFDKTPAQNPNLKDIYYCNCDQAKSLHTCRVDGKSAKPPIPAICPSCKPWKPSSKPGQKPGHSGRKKRQTGRYSSDDDVTYFYDYGLFFTPPAERNFPTPSGLTLANATQLCTDALHRSNTIKECMSRAGLTFISEIEMCVEDIKLVYHLPQINWVSRTFDWMVLLLPCCFTYLSDDLEFLHSYVEFAIMTCQEYVLRDPSFYNSATGKPPAFITTDCCPSDCSGHGTCIHGTCHCNKGYVGEACAIDSRKPPTLYNIVGSSIMNQEAENCDIQRRPCQKIYIVGDNIREHNNMKCQMKELQFSSGKFVPTGNTFETQLEYETMYNFRCHMPAVNQVQGKEVVGFNISISSDGQHHSNEVQVFTMDSDCMSCSDKGGICTIKPNTCLIDGQCRAANEHNPRDVHQQCTPRVSKDHWAATQTGTTATPLTAFNSTHFPTPSPDVQNNRSDIWTFSRTGCTCLSDTSTNDCACCDVDGCQCPGSNRQQCVQCGHTEKCGHPQPVFTNGIDGYTVSSSDCPCDFNKTRSNCACCQNNGCQCDEPNENQCVRCGRREQCGAKQWLFGAAGLIGKK